ncbi:tissue factor pathway inhibitor 2 isoform X2 [Pristis pectinata]|uniref:tissue factor pathway inhibitor 2 isoform X2 n=1 Tax=Pristis pectinata TaxID=685728 RepID=UPI00223D415B|nr:tissue factor pathway inhibitor 2 isoform X2 [Pristis pectinata]
MQWGIFILICGTLLLSLPCATAARDERNVCSQPKDDGPCKAINPRYYYNDKTQKCEEFIYGGCMGNENNFLTKDDCIAHCGRTKNKRDVCSEPADTGPCKAFFPRYYYNVKTQKCEKFIYGGCFGNENNFLSESDCIAHCGRTNKIVNKCQLPPESGICRAFLRRYFYNITTRRCEQFVFGGCHGNANNFKDISSCQMECNPISLLPSFCTKLKDSGTCTADIPRFYFNQDTYSCERFSYTGCGGNDNNFVTLKVCQKICQPRVRKQSKKKFFAALKYN